MVYVIALLSFAALATSFKLPEDRVSASKLDELQSRCITESEIDKNILDNPSVLKPENKAIETHQAHCFLKCLFVSLGYVTDEGEINFDVLQKEFDVAADHESIVAAKKCAEENKQEDICERVAMIQGCAAEASANRFKNK